MEILMKRVAGLSGWDDVAKTKVVEAAKGIPDRKLLELADMSEELLCLTLKRLVWHCKLALPLFLACVFSFCVKSSQKRRGERVMRCISCNIVYKGKRSR